MTGNDHRMERPETRLVTLMVRASCGSCRRVRGQIAPVVAAEGAVLEVVDVDAPGDGVWGGGDLAVEFGDRVPVVLVDGEEIACWEVDDDELIDALRRPARGGRDRTRQEGVRAPFVE